MITATPFLLPSSSFCEVDDIEGTDSGMGTGMLWFAASVSNKEDMLEEGVVENVLEEDSDVLLALTLCSSLAWTWALLAPSS